MQKKFELGPMQRKWVEALRSGKYKQGVHCLCRHDNNAGISYYCCLGVANELFNLNAQDNETLDETSYAEVLGLRDASGMIIDNEDEEDDSNELSLAEMNDDGGKSFIEIADFIEQNPSLVFTHSV